MLTLFSFLFFTSLVAVIAWWKTRDDRHDTATGYFLAGRSLAWPVIGGSLLLTNLSTEQMREALTGGAVDLGAAGFDSVFGYGRVDALRAKNLLRLVFDVSPINLLLDDS